MRLLTSRPENTVNGSKELKIGTTYEPGRGPNSNHPNVTCIAVNDLVQHSNVFGLTGTGKSFFIESIVKQLQEYNKGKIGILVINYAKKRQEAFFAPDVILRYGNAALSVPYFIMPREKGEVKKYTEQAAHNIVATMGLKYAVKRILPIVMDMWWQKEGQLPPSIAILLKDLIRYIKSHPYAPEFQTNLLQATANRIYSISEDTTLVRALQLIDGIPEWFSQWLAGKTIFIDLSPCDSVAKQLLTYCIFQAVRVLVPHDETNELKHLIIIDEVHQILRQPLTSDPNDEDFITITQTQTIFESLLKEFRSMGVGIMLADQQPSSLVPCAHTLASTKFLFRLNYPCNTLFTSNVDLREQISRLENRKYLALVEGKQMFLFTIDSQRYYSEKIEHEFGFLRSGAVRGERGGGDIVYMNLDDLEPQREEPGGTSQSIAVQDDKDPDREDRG